MRKLLNSKYKLGMRTFKTALSVAIGLYISNYFNLNSPIFVSIGAITTIQPSFTQTYQNVKNRIVTALIGVVLGFVFSLITSNELLTPLVAAVGIIIIVTILRMIKRTSIISLSLIVFMASFSASSDKIEYGVNRLLGTLIGLFVALAVNYLISSPKVFDFFIDSADKSYKDILKITENTILKTGEKDLNKLSKDISKANEYYSILREEVAIPFQSDNKSELRTSAMLINLFNEIFLRYELLDELGEYHFKLNYRNIRLVEKLFKYTIIFNETVEDEETVVYNYHINTILRNTIEVRDLLIRKKLMVMSDDL